MKNFARSILIAAAGLIMIVATPTAALAASNGSNSIGANPRKDYTIAPGKSVNDSIQIHNLDSKTPLNIGIGVIDFDASGQNGTPKLLVTRIQPTAWSLKPYLTVQKSATIAPDAYANIPITITIPAGLGAGSYYSAIQYATGGTTDQIEKGTLGLSSTEATLVFVRVSGKANDSLVLKNFGASVPSSDFSTASYQTLFGSSKPKFLSYTLQNEGNVANEPMGSIQIKNIFGKQYEIIPNLNPNHNLVLRGQTRRIDVCVSAPDGTNMSTTSSSIEDIAKCKEPSLWPGRYTAKLDLLYGNNGSNSNEIIAKSSFWYLPAWFIIAVAVVVLAIVGAIWLIIRFVRSGKKNRYNSRR